MSYMPRWEDLTVLDKALLAEGLAVAGRYACRSEYGSDVEQIRLVQVFETIEVLLAGIHEGLEGAEKLLEKRSSEK